VLAKQSISNHFESFWLLAAVLRTFELQSEFITVSTESLSRT